MVHFVAPPGHSVELRKKEYQQAGAETPTVFCASLSTALAIKELLQTSILAEIALTGN